MFVDDYKRAATLDRVIDGDTIKVEMDLGMRIYHKVTLRLARINAPELRNAGGPEAKAFLELNIIGNIDYIQTVKDEQDKYGRFLAEIYLKNGINLNDLMLQSGHAVLYGG